MDYEDELGPKVDKKDQTAPKIISHQTILTSNEEADGIEDLSQLDKLISAQKDTFDFRTEKHSSNS